MENNKKKSEVPLVSVIIPAFNAVATLQECLTALMLSDYPAIESIIVNDGSTDRTATLARSLSGTRLIEQANAGSAAAKNLGARHAKGDFFYFLDSDVIVERETVSQMVETAKHYKVDLVVGRYSTRPMNNDLIHHYKAMADFVQYIPPKARTEVRINHQMGGGGDFFSRLAFERLGGFSEKYVGASVEREELYLRFYKLGFRSAANPFIKTRHYFPSFKSLIKNYAKRIYETVKLLQEERSPFSYISLRNAIVTPFLAVISLCAGLLWLGGVVPGWTILATGVGFIWGAADFLKETWVRKGAMKTCILFWIHWLVCCIILISGAVSKILVTFQRAFQKK